jgi:hypothetical protein
MLTLLKRKPLDMDLCKSELWEGVRCCLPVGHQGSHQRPATEASCAISWRSSTFPPPLPPKREASKFRMFSSRQQTMEMIR